MTQAGRLTFARFMEQALYGPGGYYRQAKHPAGRPHGYLTSPAVHPLFGALLARQIEEVWRRLGSPEPFWVVEAGCGSGLLARDVCRWARQRPDAEFARAVRYVALDRASSFDLLHPARMPAVGLHGALGAAGDKPPPYGLGTPSREGWGEGRPAPVRAAGLPLRPFTGCILANELWDNLPVHRLVRRRNAPQEIYVVLNGQQWEEVEGEASPEVLAALAEAGVEAVEGQEVEVRPALGFWFREAAAALVRGLVLSIDFGYWRGAASGTGRTLATYGEHVRETDPYAAVGKVDITAAVDLGVAVVQARQAGLTPLGLTSQAAFLERLGLPAALRALDGLGLGPAAARLANRAALRELVRPEGLGAHFVLALGKGFSGPPLAGFGGSQAEAGQPDGWLEPLPLLDGERLGVLAARYPHWALEVGDLWGRDEEGCRVPEPQHPSEPSRAAG